LLQQCAEVQVSPCFTSANNNAAEVDTVDTDGVSLSYLSALLILQYASNVCGTAAAFFLSGLAYSQGGLRSAAALGALLEAVLLLGSWWYLSSEAAAVTGGDTAGVASLYAGMRAESAASLHHICIVAA
jgi:hypothetical protein